MKKENNPRSPLAYIHPHARLADDVVVEAFASIHEDVEIGAGSYIGSNAVILNGARIGNNCQIFPGAIIGSVPQDMKFSDEYTTVEIGDGAIIREYATVNRGTNYNKKTVVGARSLIMTYVHIAHDCIIGQNVVISNAVNIAGHVVIDDFAVIGGMCGVHQFSHIGKHSMIASCCMVRKDVPPFAMAGREPLSYAGVNTRGLRRRNFSAETIREIQAVYRILYLSGRNHSQAIQKLTDEFPPSDIRDEIIAFVKASPRGIIRGLRNGKHANDAD